MAYITEAQLRTYAQGQQYITESQQFIKSSAVPAATSVFLSHSHLDRGLVKGFIRLLASLRVHVYVDWQDASMPRITGRDTAEKIKKKIDELNLFIIFATANALASRWVPWEIGVADQTKALESIFVVPVTDSSGVFAGNEYLQLYNEIEFFDQGEKRLGAFHPGIKQGPAFETILKSRGYFG